MTLHLLLAAGLFLTFSDGRPLEPKFHCYRIQQKRLVESGDVTFEKEIGNYVEKHPEAIRYVLSSSNCGFHALTYYVTGLKPGTVKPDVKFLYNRKGQLLMVTGYANRTAHKRNAAGQLITSTLTRQESQRGGTSAYFYHKDGLLERGIISCSEGANDKNRYYRYHFYLDCGRASLPET